MDGMGNNSQTVMQAITAEQQQAPQARTNTMGLPTAAAENRLEKNIGSGRTANNQTAHYETENSKPGCFTRPEPEEK